MPRVTTVSRILLVTMLMVLMPLSGCFSSDPETVSVNDTDEGEEDEVNTVIDNEPQLVLWNSSMLWNGSQPIIRGAVFDEDISNLTITYELLDSQNFESISGPYIVIPNDDGAFFFNSPFVNPGSWIVKVNANDGNHSTEITAEIQIIPPDEAMAEISFVWIQPAENSSIGSLLGNVNHNFLETCIVGYDPIGSATIMLAELNYSTGSMELEINTDEVLLEGDITAACGKFSSTEKIIHVILEHDSKVDSDGDGIEDEEDLCDSTPEGEAVYSDGCSDSERDSDNDGVSDAEDQCPDTPIGEQPDVQGCSDSQKDSDSDGVNDAEDQCPDTPAGNAVDSTGCSIVTWGPEDSWYCQDGNGPWVKDFNEEEGYSANNNGAGQSGGGGGSGPWFQCQVSVSISGDELVATSNGMPNHDFLSTRAGGADEVTITSTITLSPVNDTTGGHDSTNCPAAGGQWECAPDRGSVAIATNGLPIFGPEEGPGGDAVALDFFYFDEDRQPISLGYCGGHNGPGGLHYHWDAMCQYWEPESGQTMADYDWSLLDPTQHSPIIGWAYDGYPIYGMYTYDENGVVKGMKSSYEVDLTSDGGDQGYNGIDDWNYVAGLGDLDQCNGRFGPTPEYPDGTYYYVSTPLSGSTKTVVNTNGETVPMIGFPYFMLCYHGIADLDGNDAGGGGGGGPPPPMGIQSKSVYEHMPELIHTPMSPLEVNSLLWDTTWILLLLIGVAFTRQKKQSSEVTIL